jgi:hypothetical protein
MRRALERAWFRLCLALGRLLRSARYSTVTIATQDGRAEVRKRRSVHAPLLVSLGVPLARILDTGVRVLPQRDWEERERRAYRSLHGASVRVDGDGTLLLPLLPGRTLAALLDDASVDEATRKRAIALAAAALGAMHRRGDTHGDAMAENVMIDLEAGVARWFDFETVHEARRAERWRRADDVRALLATCLLRTSRARLADTLGLLLDAYADQAVEALLADRFSRVTQRPLAFHLGQAPLSFRRYREIGRLLRARRDASSS